MKNIVLDIYRSDFESLERLYKKDAGGVMDEMDKLTELMKQKIPQEFHALLNQYENAMMNLMDSACEDDFMAGYQLGVRLLIAAWPGQEG